MAIEENNNIYGAYYYEHNFGNPYQRDQIWMSFFGSIAKRIVTDIHPQTVLDAGCAMGFLVESLRNLDVECYGIDSSEYAIQNVYETIKEFCSVGSITDSFDKQYDLIITIEVVEHMPKEMAEKAIINICSHTHDVIFSSSPFDYKEATHQNVQPLDYWVELFARQGFFRDVDFDASFITTWAIRFRYRTDPPFRIIRDYERKSWLLLNENKELRSLSQELFLKIQTLNNNEKTSQQLSEQIGPLQVQIEKQNLELQVWEKRWTELNNGLIWRFLAPVIRLRARLFPSGTRRDKFFQAFKNLFKRS